MDASKQSKLRVTHYRCHVPGVLPASSSQRYATENIKMNMLTWYLPELLTHKSWLQMRIWILKCAIIRSLPLTWFASHSIKARHWYPHVRLTADEPMKLIQNWNWISCRGTQPTQRAHEPMNISFAKARHMYPIMLCTHLNQSGVGKYMSSGY